MLRFSCPQCGSSLCAPEECAGRTTKCRCGHPITVPAASVAGIILEARPPASYQAAFAARQDLQKYGNNALLLFALELRFNIPDIHTEAADALVDGPDDKKCDLVYVDSDEGGYAIVAQAYYFGGPGLKDQAPANKAADLNTAAGWLLRRELHELPERLRPAATRLRAAITDGLIDDLQFWYVHNLPESQNVNNELITVQAQAHAALKDLLPGSPKLPGVSAIEVGRARLTDWYQSRINPILVSDTFQVDIPGGYELQAADWKAFVTAVPGTWLHRIYATHKSQLFSANIRDFLGSRKTDKNINHVIKTTAQKNPDHFWPYNNGLTILVNSYQYDPDMKRLHISGVSIVNGAQTTGAIGSLEHEPSPDVKVPARFVACSKGKIIRDIIKYNNSQNKVEAPDFRSNDSIQRRLRLEFERLGNITYLGGRRGGHEDRIQRLPNLLPSDTAGQALAALHGNPVVAYHEKSQMWISDAHYPRYFSERTTAVHIVFGIRS
jgi:hypothetical protein